MRIYLFNATLATTALLCLLTGCQQSKSSRMTAEDFNQMAIAMSQSLLESPAIAKRGPDSPLWLVSAEEVQNLTSDVMTESEQWKIVDDLVNSLPIQSLWERKNIRFVLPPEKLLVLRDGPTMPEIEPEGMDREVTHVLNATFRSATRAQLKGRTDLYYAEFELLNLHTGEPVWTDRFEFKRSAKGNVWD